MDFFDDLISTEFGLMFLLTTLVWGGFFIYLTYIYLKNQNLKKELDSLKALGQENE